jgi:hypothetical protein
MEESQVLHHVYKYFQLSSQGSHEFVAVKLEAQHSTETRYCTTGTTLLSQPSHLRILERKKHGLVAEYEGVLKAEHSKIC